MYYLLNPIEKYAEFSGRTSVKEFWLYFLFCMSIFIILIGVDIYFDIWNTGTGFGVLSGLFIFLTLIPGIAIQARRLHDTGRSGWWSLIGLVPFVGPFVLLLFLIEGGMPGNNKYGKFPSVVDVDADVN